MRLKVGETYRNKLSSGQLGSTRYKIERMWSPDIFEGRAVDSTGRSIGDPYLLSSYGTVLGFQGNSLTRNFAWSIAEDKKKFEYRLVYESLVDNSWTPITPSTPRYTYAGSKFMVREAGNNDTLRIVDRTEFLSIQKAS